MNTFEKLSAALDNEADVTELHKEWGSNPKAAEKWKHYQRIGDVLRHEYQNTLDLDFTDQVMARLEEPSIDAAPVTPSTTRENHQQKAANTNRMAWLSAFGKMTSQVALSACAAVFTVLCVQFFPSATQAPLPTVSGLDQMRPVLSYPAPVNLSIQEPVQNAWPLESKPHAFDFDDVPEKQQESADDDASMPDQPH